MLMNNNTIFVIILLVSTFLTSTLTMLPAAHAGGGDDDDHDKRGDSNKQRVEEDGAGAIADCDWNDIEESDFRCIASAATDEGIIRDDGGTTPPPPPEDAELSVTKTITCLSISGTPDDDAVCNWALESSPNAIEPSDYQITVTDNNPEPSSFAGSETPVEVSIGPGEYTVSETLADLSTLQQELDAGAASTLSLFRGNCNQPDQAEPVATGTIAAGQSQECNIENSIFFFEGRVPDP